VDNQVEDWPETKAKIEAIQAEIGKFRVQIASAGKAKAAAIKEYYKAKAIAAATLSFADTFELAGKQYPKPPATLAKEIVKGLVADKLEARELAESNYTAIVANVRALCASLSASQSIFRHME
jgi:hypothetical protein